MSIQFTPNGDEQLTRRETTILNLFLDDPFLTSQEIANDLVISPNTVGSYMKQLYRKHGVAGKHSRRDLYRLYNPKDGGANE